jgi:hypothetical protein
MAAVGSLLAVGQAHAVFIFTSVNDTLVTNYAEDYAGATLSAQITYRLDNFVDADTAIFDVMVSNTTVGQPGTNRLVGFAVDTITPSVLSVEDTTGIYTTLLDENFPGGIGTVDFCGISGPGNNCSGGGNGGLAQGASTSFFVTMNFSEPVPNITFAEPYAVRFQSVGTTGQSIVFQGCPANEPNCPGGGGPPTLIPEPSTLARLGLGLLGAGLARRRGSAGRRMF